MEGHFASSQSANRQSICAMRSRHLSRKYLSRMIAATDYASVLISSLLYKSGVDHRMIIWRYKHHLCPTDFQYHSTGQAFGFSSFDKHVVNPDSVSPMNCHLPIVLSVSIVLDGCMLPRDQFAGSQVNMDFAIFDFHWRWTGLDRRLGALSHWIGWAT
jgi:hypothetical protein